MRKFGRSAAAIVAAAAILFGGCGFRVQEEGGTEAAGSGAEGNVQMGRYVEEYAEANVQLNRSSSFTRLEDGRLAVFSYNNGPYVSSDEGKTWEPWQTEWYQNNSDYRSFQCAAIAPDGTIFVGYMDYSADVESEADAENMADAKDEEGAGDGTGVKGAADVEDAAGTEDSADVQDEADAGDEAGVEDGTETETEEDGLAGFSISEEYQLVQPDGSSRVIEIAGMSGRNGDNWLNDCWFAPDNSLYVTELESLYELSPEGKLTELFETEAYVQQLCFLEDDRMLAATEEGVRIYDRKKRMFLDSDAALDEFVTAQMKQNGNQIKYTSNSFSIYTRAGEGDNIYFVSSDGIYSHMLGGGTVEKLLEGSLCTLGNPSESIYGMLPLSDNRFLVLYGQGTGTFSWRADIPTLPEKELRVYSLERDVMVQQAVSLFQKEHQDVYVNYEVGLEKNSGQTKEDVIKALNTEILAGHGPDVLMLDGFPMDSYMEKGLLSDLGQVLSEAEQKEPIFHNIAASLEKEGKLFAIPMRTKFPGIVGPAEELAQVTDLNGLADAVKVLRQKKESGSVTGSIDAGATLQLLAAACSPAWEQENGGINLPAVEEFLTAAKEIYAAEDAGTTQEEKESWNDVRYAGVSGMEKDEAWMMLDINAQNAFLEENRLGMGYIGDIWSLEIMFSVRRQRENMFCGTLKGQTAQVFTPFTIAGILASAKEKELAEQFVGRMLSADAARGDGFFANRDAVEEQVKLNNDGDGGIIGAMFLDSGNSMKEMIIYQMTQEEVDWLYETLESLRTPRLQNDILENAVLDCGEKYLKEEMGLEAALTEIQNKVKLSMAE